MRPRQKRAVATASIVAAAANGQKLQPNPLMLLEDIKWLSNERLVRLATSIEYSNFCIGLFRKMICRPNSANERGPIG